MPKNTKGGKNHRRGKNQGDEPQIKELILIKEGHEYGRVTKMLGNCRLLAKCYNEKGATSERLCIIPGKFRKRVYVNKDDIIIVGLRSFQEDKVDVIYKYPAPEAKRLLRKGIIPDETEGTFNKKDDVFSTGIEFVGDDDDDENEKETPKQKAKLARGTNSNFIDDDMLPPSDSDSEEFEIQKKPVKKTATKIVLDLNDDEEVNIDDL